MEACMGMRSRPKPAIYEPLVSPRVRTPKGYVPLIFGRWGDDEGGTVFMVRTRLINHPLVVGLLEMAAGKFGYEHQGMIRVPCDVEQFRRAVDLVVED
ncbi:hypothetical protein QJS10_CPB21g01106 [Acorus calamus]|uniref:Small auxin up regulated protein n=1 Tax=Acorus calamus TaxID=4465 RepID=A0AAV9C6M5_ACOCL|nr:hypothetical protein QJS10_CPB21g01106 [Acorus calamus]